MRYSPLNYALKLLEKRDRSVGEIRSKLKEKEFGPEEVDKTIKFLQEKKFLDDERFAENYVRSRLSIRPQGKYLLQMKLKEKKINQEIIDKVLNPLNQEEESNLAHEAAKKWLRTHDQLNNIKKKDKLMRHLLVRGFEYEIVKDTVAKYINPSY